MKVVIFKTSEKPKANVFGRNWKSLFLKQFRQFFIYFHFCVEWFAKMFCVSVQNLPWQSANAEAFAKAYLFFSICFGKENAKAIKFSGILKIHVSKNKMYFCLKRKRNVLLNKKTNFVFHTIFKLDFITQIIYCIIHRCLYSLFILFCSLIPVSKK